MNVGSIALELRKGYDKNLPALRAYMRRLYPEFVFDAIPRCLENQIPVLSFHFIEPEVFESQLAYLASNDYRTLTADEFSELIRGSRPVPRRAVLLTFDDGWGSLWVYAYPLLEKYGMHGVSFITPGLVRDTESYSPNLSDVSRGLVPREDLVDRERSPEPLCTWPEIRTMANSGVLEFQSHTMYHSRVFVSSKIVDFFRPSFDTYPRNHNLPILRSRGRDDVDRAADWGMPIYENAPRMRGNLRYLEDEELRRQCVRFVHENGGQDFFNRRSWRRDLHALVDTYRERVGDGGSYESTEELRESLNKDLSDSKRLIEQHVPGHSVNHLCFPYFVGSDLAVGLSRNAGYQCSYWGLLEDRRGNRPGDDPFHVARLADEFIFALPGVGRRSGRRILAQQLLRDLTKLGLRMATPDYVVHESQKSEG